VLCECRPLRRDWRLPTKPPPRATTDRSPRPSCASQTRLRNLVDLPLTEGPADERMCPMMGAAHRSRSPSGDANQLWCHGVGCVADVGLSVSHRITQRNALKSGLCTSKRTNIRIDACRPLRHARSQGRARVQAGGKDDASFHVKIVCRSPCGDARARRGIGTAVGVVVIGRSACDRATATELIRSLSVTSLRQSTMTG
jgi:hypothetical protein